MAATSFGQMFIFYRKADNQISLARRTGTSSPSTFTMKASFTIGPSDAAPALEVTPTVDTDGTTILIPVTLAQMTANLVGNQYRVCLYRTDTGFQKPLATGSVIILDEPGP